MFAKYDINNRMDPFIRKHPCLENMLRPNTVYLLLIIPIDIIIKETKRNKFNNYGILLLFTILLFLNDLFYH